MTLRVSWRWVCALALLVPAVAAQANFSDGEVRIGLISDMSSVYRFVGRGAEVAAEMAIEDFGGKVRGYPIRLYPRNHESKVDVALQHAKELHEKLHVDAFLEMVGTNVSVPLQRYAKENDILALHTGSASSILTGKECAPLSVHWVYDTYALAAGTAAAIMNQGGDSWFFVTSDYAFGRNLQADAAAVVKRMGGTIVGEALHPFKGKDFMLQMQQARNSGAKVIGLANAGDDAIVAIRHAYELGMLNSDQTLAGLLVTETVVRDVGLYVAAGVKLTTAWYWDYDDQTREWAARFRKRSGITASMYTAGVYSVVLHYLKAMEAAGTDDPHVVITKMRELPVNDMFARNGKLRIDGRMVHDMYLAEVKKASESKVEGDYYKILAVIPGDQAFRPLAESDCPYVKEQLGGKR